MEEGGRIYSSWRSIFSFPHFDEILMTKNTQLADQLSYQPETLKTSPEDSQHQSYHSDD